MFLLKAEKCFDAAHFLKGYKGKCSNLHGHRWRVVAEVQSDHLILDGQLRDMVVDFKTLKKDLKEICERFDHSLIFEEGSLMPVTIQALEAENFRMLTMKGRPTAENLSILFFEAMQEKGYDVYQISVYETPDNCAVYRP